MKTKLRILLIEDDVADAELITQELKSSGFSFAMLRVQTETDFRRELETDLPDLILSDHGLPSFSGFKALEITRQEYPNLPFIFVSGSNDQGMVAQMHEEGATDYVFKRDIGDLKEAVLQALESTETDNQSQVLLLESQTISGQAEFTLQLPTGTTIARTYAPPSGHVFLCPQCHFTRDESGKLIRLEDYCDSCSETMVHRQVCADCAHPRLFL